MFDSLQSIESLSLPVRESTGALLSAARGAFENALQSVTIFGDALGDGFDPARQWIQSVVVLDRVRLDPLRRFAGHAPALRRAGLRAPYIMTPDYIRATLDTFPLEFLEIAWRRCVVAGGDHFHGMVFERAHVRMQCEREAKTALIAMRQALLATEGRESMVEDIDLDIAEGLLRTLRGLAWMSDRAEVMTRFGLVARAEELLHGPLTGLRATLDDRTTHGWAEFDLLYRDVERIGEYVNAL